MDNETFLKMREETTNARFEMCDKKSISYTQGSGDRLANFKRLAEFMNASAMAILATHYGKHDLAMWHYYKTGEESSEGIESTIDDLQNYLDLARAMYREDK